MAAFHLSLSDFKHSGMSFHEDLCQVKKLDPSDSDYAKSLMFSLQSNLRDLKNEANSLKNVTFRDTGHSNIQTFRTPEKVLDYRKSPINRAKPAKEEDSKMKKSLAKEEKLDYPTYGRGVDPAPDLDFGYMKKTTDKVNVAPMKKVIYEKNYEKYLSSKNAKSALPEENRPFTWEEPQIIKYLREEYLRLTKKTENRLLKSVLVDELVNNSNFGELFGVTEQISLPAVTEIVSNIGELDYMNIDEFLQFYQVSKNNLLKSKQIFLDLEKEPCPDLKLKLEFLLNKLVFSSDKEHSTEDLVLAIQDWLQPEMLDILQTPPVMFSSLQEFINALSLAEGGLSLELLLRLFEPPEVLDFIIPVEIINYIQEVFVSLDPESSGNVNTQVLVLKLLSEDYIKENSSVEARSPQGLPSIPSETLEELLCRISVEAPEYLTWEEFIRYFSIEGRPDEEVPVVCTESKPPLGFRYKITVPAPFKFMKRDSIKQESIRERRVKEMLKEKEAVIDKELKNKFRAKPVPAEVKIPLFEIIMKEQEDRRKILKTQFEALTKSLERPFDFYLRDLARPKPQPPEPEIHLFHANPVPWFCKLDMKSQYVQQEELRRDRINKMAKHSLSLAKMPPRMEKAAQELKEKPKVQLKFQTFQFKAAEVPNFPALQEEFANTLLEKKKGFTPTVPEPFKFHEGKKAESALKLLDYPDVARGNWEVSKKKIRSASAFSRPKITPATTEKTKNMISAKQEYFEKIKEIESRKQEEAEIRRIKHEMMKKSMKKSGMIKKTNLDSVYDEKVRERKEEMRRNEKEYLMKLQEITEKVANRPFLIEQAASHNLSRGFEGPVKKMINQEYISEAITSQEQDVSSESFG